MSFFGHPDSKSPQIRVTISNWLKAVDHRAKLKGPRLVTGPK